MGSSKEPWTWLFWHPHQGLGNARLFAWIGKRIASKRVSNFVSSAIVHLDTAILFIRVVFRRLRFLGPVRLWSKTKIHDDAELLYLDLGTHKEGAELGLVIDQILPPVASRVRAFGFEANAASFEQASAKFADHPDVRILHAALVEKIPKGGRVRLYTDDSEGYEDSLYRKSDTYEDVKALRLSDFLGEQISDGRKRIILLRMNIEGAEFDVIRDLVETGNSESIAGYFGMWDDLSKLSVQRDCEFRRFLRKHRITKITFNGRDLRFPSRIRCIAYEIHTAILRAQRGMKKR